jgi:hypothetical protein
LALSLAGVDFEVGGFLESIGYSSFEVGEMPYRCRLGLVVILTTRHLTPGRKNAARDGKHIAFGCPRVSGGNE